MNIKIGRFILDETTWENVCQDTFVSSVLGRCSDWGPRGDKQWSRPLATISRQYADIDQALALRKVPHEFMDMTNEFEFYATTAPVAYDYDGFGTMSLCSVADPILASVTDRIVAVRHETVDYQLARYSSGLYGARKLA